MSEPPAPSGTVTFLFTDIEGSTRLWEERPDEMRAALRDHDAVLRDCVSAHAGYVFATGGDGFAVAFHRAADAVAAATAIQKALASHAFVRVRMALHTGEVEERDGNYYGPALNRAARLMAAGHGQQVLLSSTTRALLGTGYSVIDLGEYQLRDLTAPDRIFQLGTATFPPLRTVDAVPGNVPSAATEFIGRQRELAELDKLVRSRSLVTLTGPGGVGKTRLALQAIASAASHYSDGAWFCDLAPISDPALVAPSAASLFGLGERAGQSASDALVEHIGPRRLLLLLDNCEHVLDAAAELAEAVLAAAPGVRVVATSREPLGVLGEWVFQVPSFELPDQAADYGALAASDVVRLFVERAAAVSHGFRLTPANAPAVADVCRHLDGIPLAVELAAARVGVFSPAELAARLDERFSLLRRGGRRRIGRHQTLEGAIDWSYSLLDETEQLVFDRLSVFPGSFTLSAAESVVVAGELTRGALVDSVTALVEKSMLVAMDSDEATRYRLLETLAQYGAAHLAQRGETVELQRRHAHTYTEQSERIGPGLEGRDAIRSFAELAPEINHLRVAADWLLGTGDLDRATRLLLATRQLWVGLAPAEGIQRFAAACAARHATASQLIALHASACSTAALGGIGRTAALAHYDACAAVAASLARPVPSIASHARAFVAYQAESDPETSVRFAREGTEQARAEDNAFIAVSCLATLGMALVDLDDHEGATRAFEEAEPMAERLANPIIQGAFYFCSAFAVARTDFDKAVDRLQQARELLTIGGPVIAGWPDLYLAHLLVDRDDVRGAAAALVEAITRSGAVLHTPVMAAVLEASAGVLARAGDAQAAARLLGAAGALRGRLGFAGQPRMVRERRQAEARVRTMLDPTTADSEFAAGQTAPLTSIVFAALAALRAVVA